MSEQTETIPRAVISIPSGLDEELSAIAHRITQCAEHTNEPKATVRLKLAAELVRTAKIYETLK